MPGAQSRLPGVTAAIARRSARSATARGGQASRPSAAEAWSWRSAASTGLWSWACAASVAVVLAELPAVLAGRGPPAFRDLPLLHGQAARGRAVELPVPRARPPGLARSRVPLAVRWR
jgi:hypothetical protein